MCERAMPRHVQVSLGKGRYCFKCGEYASTLSKVSLKHSPPLVEKCEKILHATEGLQQQTESCKCKCFAYSVKTCQWD